MTGLSPSFQNLWFAYTCPVAEDVPVNLPKCKALDDCIESKITESEASIAAAIAWIDREIGRARLEIFRTAPLDLEILEGMIASKSKEYGCCKSFPERVILRVELETLVALRDIIRASAATA